MLNMNEVNKCLKCKNAKCTNACPIATDVPTVMRLIEEGKREEAQKVLFENNPFSAVCSIVCDHQKQCYGNCILNFKQDPVEFYKVEEDLSMEYLENLHFAEIETNNIKVAVVGAGPAGLTAAFKLALHGYAVTVFDKFPKIGGVLRYGIPEKRLSKEILNHYERILKELDIRFRPNCEIGLNFKVNDILKDGYEAVFLGTGAWYPKPLRVKGETLPNVHNAIDYLKTPENFDLGKKVIVIGAGNVAMDAASVAADQGYDTYIYYRKTYENMPASNKEIMDVQEAGVKFVNFKAPYLFTSNGAYFNDTENIVVEDRVKTKILENTTTFVECDSIITAVSQGCDLSYLSDCMSIEKTSWNTIKTNDDFQTSNPDVFAGGDTVSGAATVVSAVNQAKKAAEAMHRYLKEKVQ